MNPIGVHALVWREGWAPDEAEYAIRATKEAGYDFIEIPLLDPSSVDFAMTSKLLKRYRITAACSLGLSFQTDVSSDEPEISEAGERHLMSALEVTVGVGARYLGGVVYSAMGKYLEPSSPQRRERAVEILGRVARMAQREGVDIGIEAVNRYESNIVNTAAQAVSLTRDIGEPNVFVHLDTYHMNIEENDMAAPVHACGPLLRYVHIGESHRGYLGTGTVDFGGFFRALTAVGYEGPIAFESFSSEVISQSFCSALAVWRDRWNDSMSLATHARSFLHTQLVSAAHAKG